MPPWRPARISPLAGRGAAAVRRARSRSARAVFGCRGWCVGGAGTEWAANPARAGETFVLIEAAAARGGRSAACRGRRRGAPAAARDRRRCSDFRRRCGRLRARALRPPSPVHLRCEPQDGRRSRCHLGPAEPERVAVDERQRHPARRGAGGVSRDARFRRDRRRARRRIGQPGFTYAAAERAADGVALPLTVRVAQLGTSGRLARGGPHHFLREEKDMSDKARASGCPSSFRARRRRSCSTTRRSCSSTRCSRRRSRGPRAGRRPRRRCPGNAGSSRRGRPAPGAAVQMPGGVDDGGWRFVRRPSGMTSGTSRAGLRLRWDGSGWSGGGWPARAVRIGGKAVVGERRPEVANPSGGTIIDVEARAAVSAVIATLMSHGLID